MGCARDPGHHHQLAAVSGQMGCAAKGAHPPRWRAWGEVHGVDARQATEVRRVVGGCPGRTADSARRPRRRAGGRGGRRGCAHPDQAGGRAGRHPDVRRGSDVQLHDPHRLLEPGRSWLRRRPDHRCAPRADHPRPGGVPPGAGRRSRLVLHGGHRRWIPDGLVHEAAGWWGRRPARRRRSDRDPAGAGAAGHLHRRQRDGREHRPRHPEQRRLPGGLDSGEHRRSAEPRRHGLQGRGRTQRDPRDRRSRRTSELDDRWQQRLQRTGRLPGHPGSR